jgi:2-oxoglutarate ferredoxin oxidoreductase subunit gamma
MSGDLTLLLAGFGGQGLLFAGKVAAYAGLIDGKEISWLPSYGPEMRGGTANCSVTISEEPIGSPLILNPHALIVMNRPSYDKFIDTAANGAVVLVDSSMIDKKTERTDVTVFYVPATGLAEESGMKGLANIILLGKLLKETGFTSLVSIDKALTKCVSSKHGDLLEQNRKAFRIGMEL